MDRYLPSKTLSYLSVLVFPLSSLYISLRYFRRPEAKNIFWLFCTFLGMIHIFFPVGGSGADGTRYAMKLMELHYLGVTWENFKASLFIEGGYVDLYQPLLTFLISMFTANPHWLFTAFAVIFGFFYSRNMWYVLARLPQSYRFAVMVLVLYFFLLCPIWNINGVRMWTALHVFAYGALPYLHAGEKKKLAWCFASLFFHFSFFIPLAILLIYRFIPRKVIPLLVFYLITFLIKSIDMEQVRSVLSFLPDFLQPRVAGYTNEDYVQSFMESKDTEGMNSFVYLATKLSGLIISILLIYISTTGKNIFKNDLPLLNLLCFSLFIYSISNILSLIPSGARFITVSQMFTVPTFIFYFANASRFKHSNLIDTMMERLTLLLIFPIILSLRMGCDFYGITLLTNPALAYFANDNTPFILLIKQIF